MVCPDCRKFFLYCCACSSRSEKPLPCHHFRLVFSDGACRLNGQFGATAGIGVLYGEDTETQQAIPITSSLDPGQKRTSQRAELLAALTALEFIAEADRLNSKKAKKKSRNHDPGQSEKAWVIATDSEYVVKGMTEWLGTWKVIPMSHSQLAESMLIEANRGGIAQWASYQPRHQACQSGFVPEAGCRNHCSGDAAGFEDWLLAYPSRVQHHCRCSRERSFYPGRPGMNLLQDLPMC